MEWIAQLCFFKSSELECEIYMLAYDQLQLLPSMRFLDWIKHHEPDHMWKLQTDEKNY